MRVYAVPGTTPSKPIRPVRPELNEELSWISIRIERRKDEEIMHEQVSEWVSE